ncbi:MAG: Gfo/Idh/MocA family oxidoreductase [Nitrospirota bacterium]|nr:Gfo/Idh/MocA family oxidoreductase [Nitrospirota bacterium]
MCNVKIFGAGSIGNHLAHASRSLGWNVTICDVDQAALDRTKQTIYPTRYGKWDEAIKLSLVKNAPQGGFDLVVVGTPPDSHLPLALAALEEKPKAILVEKPLCPPNLDQAQKLHNMVTESGTLAFVGYDHVVGKAAQETLQAGRQLSTIETIDVEFREHWGGIFAAHPWLQGPQDSYLGFWKRGGGASGEHSHAINLWQFLSGGLGKGRITEVSATLDYVQTDMVEYDKLCLLSLRTDAGLIGRVVQDVITSPSRKWARIQGNDGFAELTIGHQPGIDRVDWKTGGGDPQFRTIQKTRPDDFIWELQHIEGVMTGKTEDSVLSLERGLETMLVVAAAHLSAAKKRTVRIDYQKGYTPQALEVL